MKRRKQGGEMLEDRKFKKNRIKITIWGESSQTDRQTEAKRTRKYSEPVKRKKQIKPFFLILSRL